MNLCSEVDKSKFKLLCDNVCKEELNGDRIGTLNEKRLHKILKRYICPDENCHEIRIHEGQSIAEINGRCGKIESGKGGYIADIFDNGKIFEIQTGSFYPLKKKIEFYLNNTDYDVTVVHPIAKLKWVMWIDKENGDISKKHKSPKKGRESDILPELFWLSEYLENDRLHFRILLLEIEEYRILDGWSKDKKRGSNRFERIPVSLFDDEIYDGKSILNSILPTNLDSEFTSKDIKKTLGFQGRKLSCVIKLLCDKKIIEKCGKVNKSFVYQRT